MPIRVGVQRAVIGRVAVWGGLTGFLGVVQFISSTDDWLRHLLTGAGCVVALLMLADASNLAGLKWGRGRQAAGLIGVVGLASALYAFGRSTLAAWALVIVLFVLVAWLDQFATATFRSRIGRWVARLVLAGVGGFVPIVLNQIETRFSDEEFFVFVQGIALAGFCFLFLSGVSYLGRHPRETLWSAGKPTRLQSWLVVIGVAGVTLGLGLWGVTAYQGSFYTQTATGYPGITETSPFLCGQVAPDPQQPSGEDVYQRLLARVEANPRKGAPELGMLALGTGERHWAESFREAILAEARAGQFTGPANSVKSGQYEAALRVYYAPRVRTAFPGLFTDQEWSTLRAWFAAINRRALTVEWVDWMYALAFSKWPEGPYENQENGAGLLAMLEADSLSPTDMSPANRDYLQRNRRGWVQRFRNTDDSYLYQPEWMTNAFFQLLYENLTLAVEQNRRLSFEWLLLQVPPDGTAFSYNFPGRWSAVSTYYFGARLLNDPRYVWLADRALADLEAHDGYARVQPGVEEAAHMMGISPTEGTCLMYGDSGLPNQKGPLAPDKIVFRDGWLPSSAYMTLDLRFAGWHRYKATNAIISLYQNGPLIVEQSSGKPFGWLPRGRAAFRDKRVPRENLNGLLVPQSGMAHVLYILTSIGSGWAQDPPHYAQVEMFESLTGLDVSRTTLDNWRGWDSTRSVYFFHEGPIIVFDSAWKRGGESSPAIIWHLIGSGRRVGESIWLREGAAPARVALSDGDWTNISMQPETALDESTNGWRLTYQSPEPGQLNLATMFLMKDWATSVVTTSILRNGISAPIGQFTNIKSPAGEISILQNEIAGRISFRGLSTSGTAVVVWTETGKATQVCYVGKGEFAVPAPQGITQVVDASGIALKRGVDWDSSDGSLQFSPTWTGAAGCVRVER